MNKEFLGERRAALEEEFFARQNEQLKRALREQESHDSRRDSLAEASGVDDAGVLEHLLALDISAETFAALRLVPLVETAWADGRVDDKEREAILAAARRVTKLKQRGPAHQLLESWLTERPSPRLVEAWTEYVTALCATLDEQAREQLRTEIMGAARGVAEAAGGILGVHGTSKAEQAKLEALARAFGE